MTGNSKQTDIDDLKLDQLRMELKKRTLDHTGRKVVLAKRLKEALKSNYIIDDDEDSFSSTSTTVDIRTHRNRTKRTTHNFLRVMNCIEALKKRIQFMEITVTKLKISCKKKARLSKESTTPDKQSETNISKGKSKIDESRKRHHVDCEKIAKKKLLLLADNQGRNCTKLLTEATDSNEDMKNCEFMTIFKPNAKFRNVTDNLEELTENFGRQDHVVVITGSNDITAGTELERSVLDRMKLISNKTNVMVVSVSGFYHNSTFRHQVYDFNNRLRNYCRSEYNTRFLDTNKLLSRGNLSRDGIHLNKSGKLELMRHIIYEMKFVEAKICSSPALCGCNKRNSSHQNEQTVDTVTPPMETGARNSATSTDF